jgi:hypothetical protein
MAEPVLLKKLLADRHWQSYSTFCRQYDKAARTIDKELVGSYPSRPQLHRWQNGELIGLPHPYKCQVLEAMFPGVLVTEMFEPLAKVEAALERPDVGVLVAAGLDAPVGQLGTWRADQLAAA